MSAEILIPWSATTTSPLRKQRLQEVLLHLAGVVDELGVTVRLSDVGEGEPWSPGRARNRAGFSSDASVLVFNDADTLVDVAQIRNAIQEAAAAPGLVYGYDLYVRQDQDGRPIDDQLFFQPSSFGCAAISRACFVQLNGFDERFRGWGYEDCELAHRASRRWTTRRVSGPANHLWHGERGADDAPGDADPVQTEGNLLLWRALSTV